MRLPNPLKLSWKKKLLLLLVVIILVVIGGAIYASVNKGSGIQTETVKRGSVTETVSDSGVVNTDGRINIYSPTNGIVQQLNITNGQTVQEGQLLFIVKSTANDQEQATAWSNYQSAISSQQIAENTLRDRQATVDLVLDDVKGNDDDESFTQKQQRTTAEASRDSAFDNVKAARAQVNAAWLAYQATQNASVTAPISGTITNLAVTQGSSITANTTTPVALLENVTTTEVMLAVSESDITKLKPELSAIVTVDALNKKQFKGHISRVDKVGSLIQQVMSYKVYIEITDPATDLRPGMSVDADIQTSHVDNVLIVPNSAVKPYQGGKGVRIPTDKPGETQFVPVEIGIKGQEYTQIISGLEEGQVIVSAMSNAEVQRKGPFGF